MATIKLNKKEYELKFSYLTILALEKTYKLGVSKIFTDIDMESVSTLTTFVHACLKHEKDFANATVEDVALALDGAFESGDVTFDSLADAVASAVDNSVIAKQSGQAGNGAKKGKK